jgi:hypothetical protein
MWMPAARRARADPMPSEKQIRAAEIARGLQVKRRNAATAILTGAALAVLCARWYPGVLAPTHIFPGLLAGLIYANAFEYILHRFLLHWGDGFLVQRHALHHDSAGAPNEARYVNFATSPLVVILVFAINAPAAFAIEGLLHAGLAVGMIAGFTIYYVAYEEIHWRIHFGGWLPPGMRFARRHHMLHHGGAKGRYNVFLPVFDWVFERREWKRNHP